jgi:hypothetical protein
LPSRRRGSTTPAPRPTLARCRIGTIRADRRKGMNYGEAIICDDQHGKQQERRRDQAVGVSELC